MGGNTPQDDEYIENGVPATNIDPQEINVLKDLDNEVVDSNYLKHKQVTDRGIVP